VFFEQIGSLGSKLLTYLANGIRFVFAGITLGSAWLTQTCARSLYIPSMQGTRPEK